MLLLISGPSLSIHFLCTSVCHLFFILPLPFSHCLTLHLISCLWVCITSSMLTKNAANRMQKGLIVLHQCRIGGGGGVWLSHSNLCRVKHRISIVLSTWAVFGVEKWWEWQMKKQDGETIYYQLYCRFLFLAQPLSKLSWASLDSRRRRQRDGWEWQPRVKEGSFIYSAFAHTL